jgi:polysaccharide export outer membrane protein
MNTRQAEFIRSFLRMALCVVVATIAAGGAARGAQPQSAQQADKSPAASSARTPSQPAPSRAPAEVLASVEEDYRIGVSDVIEVQIENAPELSRAFRVTMAGTFLMPYLGRITAAQKTPEELAQYIAERLRGDYLKDPKVTVVVKEYNSRSFFIQGSVRNPGVFQIEGRPTLLTLITLAGGLAADRGSSAIIIRPLKRQQGAADEKRDGAQAADRKPSAEEEDDYELITVNINGLLKGRFDQNARLEPGDIVNIPPADVFFVAGEVKAPGSFPLKDGTTLRQAISLAQGTTFKAALGRAKIFREDPATGKRQEIAIEIDKVMSGKKEDIAILANDIIIVPNSQLKSIGGTLLSAFGLTTAQRGVPIR